jgi:hypothetical protein
VVGNAIGVLQLNWLAMVGPFDQLKSEYLRLLFGSLVA